MTKREKFFATLPPSWPIKDQMQEAKRRFEGGKGRTFIFGKSGNVLAYEPSIRAFARCLIKASNG